MQLVRTYHNRRRHRDTLNELSQLSNRELDDLGISRVCIQAVAARAI